MDEDDIIEMILEVIEEPRKIVPIGGIFMLIYSVPKMARGLKHGFSSEKETIMLIVMIVLGVLFIVGGYFFLYLGSGE